MTQLLTFNQGNLRRCTAIESERRQIDADFLQYERTLLPTRDDITENGNEKDMQIMQERQFGNMSVLTTYSIGARSHRSTETRACSLIGRITAMDQMKKCPSSVVGCREWGYFESVPLKRVRKRLTCQGFSPRWKTWPPRCARRSFGMWET